MAGRRAQWLQEEIDPRLEYLRRWKLYSQVERRRIVRRKIQVAMRRMQTRLTMKKMEAFAKWASIRNGQGESNHTDLAAARLINTNMVVTLT